MCGLGPASRGTFKGIWGSWLAMLLSVEETARSGEVRARPWSLDPRSEQKREPEEAMPSSHSVCPSKLRRSSEAAKAFLR